MNKKIGFLLAVVMLLAVVTPNVSYGAPASLTANVNKTSVVSGDTVTVTGKYDASAWITLRVIDGQNSLMVVDAQKVGADGVYSFSFVVPAAAVGSLKVLTGSGAQVASQVIHLNGTPDPGGSGNGNAGSAGPIVPALEVVKDGTITLKPEVSTGTDGRTQAKSEVSEASVKKALEQGANKVTLAVEATGSDAVHVQVSLASLKLVSDQNKQAVVDIVSELGSYQLPVSLIDFSALSEQLKTTADKLIVRIIMAKASSQQAAQVSGEVSSMGASIVAPIIEYTLEVAVAGAAGAEGRSKVVADFGQTYVNRSLELNQTNFNPSQATGVRVTPAGELTFVPATFTKVNGKWIATLKSNSNSLYTVIDHKQTFVDTASHWAKADIEQLASKLVVQGVTDQSFAPEDNVTRAQFTAFIVRALGLEGKNTSPFGDVTTKDWYHGAVAAASEAKLISGYEDGSFQPNQVITRQELAVLIHRALQYAGKQGSAVDAGKALLVFKDQASIASWAKQAVAEILAAGITNGQSEDRFEASAQATRAEATVMIKRMLQKAEFIN